MFRRAVGMCDREPVFYGVPDNIVVVRVIDLFVHDSLKDRVLGGDNLQSAAVEKIVCLSV